MRLIDADALPMHKVKIVHAFGIVEGCVVFPDTIAKAPTIDAVPVVHARWILRGCDDNDAGIYYCSACKDERYFGDEVITSEEASKYCPFCPNCGAKMDGGASDVKD